MSPGRHRSHAAQEAADGEPTPNVSLLDTCDELGLAIITWIECGSRPAFLVMAGLGELARDVAAYLDDRAPGCPAGAPAGELPPRSGLADDEDMAVAGGVGVAPAGAARARRGARQRGDVGAPALVQRPGAGHLLRPAPGAVHLVRDERLPVAGA
jgi:hypothetical protein